MKLIREATSAVASFASCGTVCSSRSNCPGYCQHCFTYDPSPCTTFNPPCS